MHTLVTGGAGFIGSHVVEALRAAGHTVVVLDNLSRGHRDNVAADVPLVTCDVASAEVHAIVAAHRPAAIFHLAAQIDVRVSVRDPAEDARVNVLGTLNVLQAAAAYGVGTVVFSSTGGAIYGEQQVHPAPETHPCAPVSAYGVSKYCAENYVAYMARGTDLRTVTLRYSNVYGPRQDPHGEAGVVAIFAERLLNDHAVSIYGDGKQTRDFVYVGDVAHANLAALDQPQAHGVYNIGTGRETGVHDLYLSMAFLCGAVPRPTFAPARAGEQRRSSVDAGRAARELGWQPRTGLQEGLQATLAWFHGRKRVARR